MINFQLALGSFRVTPALFTTYHGGLLRAYSIGTRICSLAVNFVVLCKPGDFEK